MPSIKDLFPDKWLRPEHLRGHSVPVAIAGAQVEQLFNPRTRKNGPKLVLEFHGKQLRLPLNKTQANALAAITGTDDYSQWRGHQCVLSPGIAPNQQPTIQISPVPDKPPHVNSAAAATADEDDDHIDQMAEDAAAEARAAVAHDG